MKATVVDRYYHIGVGTVFRAGPGGTIPATIEKNYTPATARTFAHRRVLRVGRVIHGHGPSLRASAERVMDDERRRPVRDATERKRG